MLSIALLHTVDPSLGRLDYALMSEDARIEAFFEGCNKEDITDEHGSINLESEFERNNNAEIESITLSDNELDGTLSFGFLPKSVISLNLKRCGICGPIDAKNWPRALVKFALKYNALCGELITADMPRTLADLRVRENRLEGNFHTSDLPAPLTYIDISNNNFSGTFNADVLPQKLTHLLIQNNAFDGKLFASDISSAIEIFRVEYNQFTEIDVKDFTYDIEEIDFQGNPLTRVAVGGACPDSIRRLAKKLYGESHRSWAIVMT